MKTTSKNRIDITRYTSVMWSRICPGCGDYTIVDQPRFSKGDYLNPGKFLGSYHRCGGPNGHKCWHMSKPTYNSKKPIYETFGPESRK